MKEINIVVWGLGPHAIKNILPALKSALGIHLYGICSRNKDVVSQCAADLNCLSWSDSTEMLADSKVDVVYLATPIGLHASQGRSVLLANKHLWCEKPLAENLEQVLMLVDLSRERDLSLAEGFMYLYHSQFTGLQEILNTEKLGHVKTVTCRFGIPTLDQPGFRTDQKLGGGTFLDVGSYPCSAISSLFPSSSPEVIHAEITFASGASVDSEGLAMLRYKNGTNVSLEWGSNCSYRNEIDFWGSEKSVFTERIFSKSSDYIPRFRFLDLNGRESYKSGSSENHFLAMFDSFRKLIDNSVAAENERTMMIRRAQLMNNIKQKAQI